MRVNCEQRHIQAMMAPRSVEERALTHFVRGIDGYVALLEQLREQIAPDRYSELSQSVEAIGRALLTLTKGPLGRLDATLLREALEKTANVAQPSTVVPLKSPPSIGKCADTLTDHQQHSSPSGNIHAVGQP